jgi:MFS family permease
MAWGWLLYSFNPSVPLLAAEQHVSGAVAGLHGTAMAIGSLAAGWLAPRAVGRFGRPKALAVGALLLGGGVVALLLGRGTGWTLAAMLVLSTGGVGALSASTVGLARHHPHRASAVLSEANGVGSGIGLLGPLAVGGSVALGWGWRPAVAVTVLLAAVVLLATRRTVDAPVPVARTRTGATLPWSTGIWFLAALVAGIAMEFATTFWATALVRQQTGAQAGIATATTSGLLVGMTAARLALGPFAVRLGPPRMLAVAFVVAAGGWALLWTATGTGVAVAGLAVMGAGIGLTAPLSQSMVLAAAGTAQDQAQGRSSIASGIAVGLAPFILGAVGDRVGTHGAFVLVPALAVAGLVAALAGHGRERRRVAALAAALPALD